MYDHHNDDIIIILIFDIMVILYYILSCVRTRPPYLHSCNTSQDSQPTCTLCLDDHESNKVGLLNI